VPGPHGAHMTGRQQWVVLVSGVSLKFGDVPGMAHAAPGLLSVLEAMASTVKFIT
jgi:hypothetical protein